jgi:hypothetical protein
MCVLDLLHLDGRELRAAGHSLSHMETTIMKQSLAILVGSYDRRSERRLSKTRLFLVLLLGIMTLSFCIKTQSALGGTVDLTFTTPMNTTATSNVSIIIGGAFFTPVPIPTGTDAPGKRDLILASMQKDIKSGKVPAFTIDTSGTTGITISNLTKGTKVTFGPGATGEAKDTQTASITPLGGSIVFGNTAFAARDTSGNPSTFTAGVITDLGELSFTIPATSLPSLDGAAIASALFADLAPDQASHGFGITDNGDELDFTFIPALTTTIGGIAFGTTAPTEGLTGSLIAVPEAGAWMMMLLGFAGLGYVGFRRTRKVRVA